MRNEAAMMKFTRRATSGSCWLTCVLSFSGSRATAHWCRRRGDCVLLADRPRNNHAGGNLQRGSELKGESSHQMMGSSVSLPTEIWMSPFGEGGSPAIHDGTNWYAFYGGEESDDLVQLLAIFAALLFTAILNENMANFTLYRNE